MPDLHNREIQLVIFDLDGTLVDAYAAVARSLNFVMRELGLARVRKGRIIRAVGWGERHLLSQFVPSALLDRAVRMYRPHHNLSLKNGAKLMSGARPLLARLIRKGYRLAVASNRATRFTKLVMSHLDIERYFETVLCRDRVPRPKPFPDILNGILKKMHLNPHAAVFVGDMAVDLAAGQKAGIRTIGISTGSHTPRELRAMKPNAMIRRLNELPDVLKRFQSG